MPQARHDRVFGRRNSEHTIIIASGDRIRHFTVRPWQAGLCAAVACLFLVGYMAATAWLFMRDDLAKSARAGEASMARQYEERIASLRAQVDRIKSRQLVGQQEIEDSIGRLLRRQELLSLRHGELAPLVERARSAGLLAAGVPVPQPRPTDDTSSQSALSAIEAATATGKAAKPAPAILNAYLPESGAADGTDPLRGLRASGTDEDAVQKISGSLSQIETDQSARLETLTARAIEKAHSIRTVLAGTGVAVPDEGGPAGPARTRGGSKAAAPGMGGPFIRLDDPDRFHAGLKRLDLALDRLESMRSRAVKLPFGRPLDHDVVTSPFGSRDDPFLEKLAFHPGVDLRASRGTPVHATGAGTVVHAGPDAGYGNMVEIDHGSGVTSRYGHLSQVLVSVGDRVRTGDVVGESGSTGRSTGPHLHYEVRLDGHPVDPERFLNSGLMLQALLRR